jgi:hypothetical protein
MIIIRGVTIMTHAPEAETDATQAPQAPQQESNAQPQKGKTKPQKTKASEPELIVIPLEEMEQQPGQSEAKRSS